jgi:hypothetical protein
MQATADTVVSGHQHLRNGYPPLTNRGVNSEATLQRPAIASPLRGEQVRLWSLYRDSQRLPRQP